MFVQMLKHDRVRQATSLVATAAAAADMAGSSRQTGLGGRRRQIIHARVSSAACTNPGFSMHLLESSDYAFAASIESTRLL